MKITKEQLKQIIKEELEKLHEEESEDEIETPYDRGRKFGKAGKKYDDGLPPRKDGRPYYTDPLDVEEYGRGWASGHTLKVTGGA